MFHETLSFYMSRYGGGDAVGLQREQLDGLEGAERPLAGAERQARQRGNHLHRLTV